MPSELLLAGLAAGVGAIVSQGGRLVGWALQRAGLRDRQVRRAHSALEAAEASREDLREEVHQATEALRDFGPYVRRNRLAVREVRREVDAAESGEDIAGIDLAPIDETAPLSGSRPTDHYTDGGRAEDDD